MIVPRDSYLGFAHHYDAHGWDWYGRVHGPRLADLLVARGLAGGRVLDAGCGTGTFSLLLAGRGFRTTGLDLSEQMLKAARAKDGDGSVRWERGDVTSFDLGGTFDAVFCVNDVLNHLERLEAWEAALRRFRAHLRPGGLLYVDVMTCFGLSRHEMNSVREDGDRSLFVALVWDPASRRSTLRVTSFLRVPGTNLWDRAQETITEWGQPVAGILERLDVCGFGAAERPFAENDDPEREERLGILATCAR